MHNHVDHRWIKAFLRKTISILLVYSLFFTNTAYASNVGGWTLGGGVAQGASTVFEGTKKVVIDGVDYIKKGTAKITPTASGVAKVLARGGAGYALSVAVEQLLGSVDWVLDPANNQIRYKESTNGKSAACVQVATSSGVPAYVASKGWTNYTCSAFWQSGNQQCTSISGITKTGELSGLGTYCTTQPLAQDEEKTLPLDVVAQKVISNAQSGDTNAQAATTAAAADIVAEAEKDNTKARPIAQQLEASSQTKPADEAAAESANTATGTQTQNPAKPETTDLALEFPTFCGWAPLVCEAAQVVISFPQTLTNWWETGKSKAEEWATSISEAWTDAKEWAKNDEIEDTDNDPPEIQEIDIGALDTSTFQGVAGCPAPIQVPITFGTGGETEISYEPICQLADKWSFVAPLIGFLSGAMILVGVGRKGEDGEI